MKPPKFHVGQAVVWVATIGIDPQDIERAGYEGPLPRRGPVYHVREMGPRGEEMDARNGDWFYALDEISTNAGFPENGFAPVEELPNEALAELLEEVFTPVNA